MSMDYQTFKDSLSSEHAPPKLSNYQQALWHDANDNWEKAHELIQDSNNKDAAWIHAYLHRKEGDDGNAAYWYARAGKPIPSISLQEEWTMLVKYFIANK